jgi:(E)-4-hydroxy-3-methylbut-2-enyl-diphosphate synthase
VNGPGEARDADIGIAAGNKRGHLFVKGVNIAVVPEDEMVPALVEWAEYIDENGVDAALERASSTRETARREAERDRATLLAAKGDDANHAEQRIDLIRAHGRRPDGGSASGTHRST